MISPNPDATATTISRMHVEDTKSQMPSARADFSGDISVFPSASVNDFNETSSGNTQPSTCSSGLVQPIQPVASTSPGVSSTSVAKDVRAKCTKSFSEDAVQHTPVNSFPDFIDVAVSPLTQVSGILHTKDSSTPVLPMFADRCQARQGAPRPFSGSNDCSSETISGSPTSTAGISTAPIVSFRNIDAHTTESPLSCPPKDITRVESAVATVFAVSDIDVLQAGDPLVDLKRLEEQEQIAANDEIDAKIQTRSKIEGISISTPSPPVMVEVMVGEVTTPSMLSKSKRGSSALSDFKRKSAPISLGSDSMPPACPGVKSADRSSPDLSQGSTTKRTRKASPRSTFNRALQAIRDASVTLSEAHNASDKPTNRQNEAGSTSLDNQDVPASVTAAVSLVPPVPSRAHPTSPRPLTIAKVENRTTSNLITSQTQPITTPSASDVKASNPTLISSPEKVPCVAFDHSTVKSSEGVVLPHASILCNNTPLICSSIVTPINREQVSSTTSRMKDAKPIVRPSTHSGKARAVVRRATSIPVTSSNNLSSPTTSSLGSAQHASDGVAHKTVQGPMVIPSSSNIVTPMSLEATTSGTFIPTSVKANTETRVRTAPACSSHTSKVREDSTPMWAAVEPDTLNAMVVDEPVPACTPASQINTFPITSVTRDLDTAPIFPALFDHNTSSSSLSASENPASVTAPLAVLPPLIEHHPPTMPSFTFGIDKCLQSVTGYSFDYGASLPVQQTQNLEWPCHLPQVTSPPAMWNTVDSASCTPEYNPWQNVRSFAPSLFYATPSPLPAVGTVESQSIPSVAEQKVAQWPYSMLTPQLSLSGSRAPGAPSMERHGQTLFADEAEMMVVDDPKPVEEFRSNALSSSGLVAKEVQPATSASDTRDASVIPWKAPSLRKRVLFETMDNDNLQPSGSRWKRDSSQNFQHFGEQRDSKRLKCTTCLDCKSDTHNSSSWVTKRDGENGRRTVKKRASKADLAEDWRFRQKPVLLRATLSNAHAHTL